jgi:hypothetical protein
MRAHYGHWVAVPLLVYRGLWWAVGIRSYLPYVGLAVALHLLAAVLLWVVMRRSAVRPWTASIAASAFALFGAGAQDILWAFQIAFSLALVLGLVHLLLADHDGPVDSRDWLGSVAGLFSLMCSGVAVTMVVVVGVAVLLRRGWRTAALHALPLASVYALWWFIAARGKYSSLGSVRQFVDWCAAQVGAAFGALGSVPGSGWLLGAFLIAGALLVARGRDLPDVLRQYSMAVGLLAGVGVFVVLGGLDRSELGTAAARSSRYLHVLAALALPALAVAFDALLERSRLVGVVALAVLLVGIPGNVADARDYARQRRPGDDVTRSVMLTVPRMRQAADAPPTLRPEPNRAPTVTLGWLRAGIESGRVPGHRAPSALVRSTNRLRLSLMELDERSGLQCVPLRSAVEMRLDAGDRIGIGGQVVVALLDRGRAISSPVVFGSALLNPGLAHTLVAVAGPLNVRIAPGPIAGPFGSGVCRNPA